MIFFTLLLALLVSGQRWPHKGWIGRPESLQWPLQTWPGPSFAEFSNHAGRAGSKTVLLTGRLQRTVSGVREVLAEYGVHPEECYLKPDDCNDATKNMEKVHAFKKDVIRRLLRENPRVNVVKMWDDRQDNIDAFRRLRKEYQNIDFQLYKVDCEDFKNVEKFSKKHKLNGDGFSNSVSKLVSDLGFGCTRSFDAAVWQGIEFIQNAWASCLGIPEYTSDKLVRLFGSYPLRKTGDVDLCLLAPASMSADECILKLAADISMKGISYIHTAIGIRCPRMKVRARYSNIAPIDFDIIFAPCLSSGAAGQISISQIYESGDKAVKSAVEGILFLEKVQSCIEGKVRAEVFGKLVDLIVYYLKTKHLKGNAFHCMRTFHLVRALAEMFSKAKDKLEDIGEILRTSFEHLASLDRSYWQRICKETVPEKIIDMTVESFIAAATLIDQSQRRDSLFSRAQFPPKGYVVVSVRVASLIDDLQWRASIVMEAKVGTCLRKLYSSGVCVVPGPSDYETEILFAIPQDEMSLRICQSSMTSLKAEPIFLNNKSDLNLFLKIGNS